MFEVFTTNGSKQTQTNANQRKLENTKNKQINPKIYLFLK